MDTENLDEMAVIEDADDQIEVTEEQSEDEEEDTVSIEGETPPEQEEQPQRAPEWVRELRKNYRALQEKVRTYEQEQKRAPEHQAPSIPQKPTLEDYDYDTEEYDKALEKYYVDKSAYDEHQRKLQAQAEEQQKQAKKYLEGYAQSKQKLKVPDFDVAEDAVVGKLSIDIQNVILTVSDNPAAVVYALGKNKAKLEEMAKIDNPFLFAKELGKLEGKLKVERRNAPPAPEKVVTGTVGAGSGDATLERLREEARRTGDMSKVMAYKRSKK